MDANIKKYIVALALVVVGVYVIAHVDVLRENILGLPPMA